MLGGGGIIPAVSKGLGLIEEATSRLSAAHAPAQRDQAISFCRDGLLF
jgi:hypothetical protein